MASNKIVVIDFGGQYNQLIARRVRQCHVYSEVLPYTIDLEKLKDPSIKGIIFTGGPNSVYLEESPKNRRRFRKRYSLLGSLFLASAMVLSSLLIC